MIPNKTSESKSSKWFLDLNTTNTGSVFTTAVFSLNIPDSGLFADFVKRFQCFHG